VVQEQQGKLLTLISPLSPLIEAIPLHLDAAKHDINDSVREVKILSTAVQETVLDIKTDISESLCFTVNRTPPLVSVPAPPLSPLSSPSPLSSRKRRRKTEPSESPPSKSVRNSSDPTQMPQDSASRPTSHQFQDASSCITLGSYDVTQTLVPDQSYGSAPSFSLSRSDPDGLVAPYASNLSRLHTNEAQPIDSQQPAPTAMAENPGQSVSGPLTPPPIMIPGLASSIEISRLGISAVPSFLEDSIGRTPVPIEAPAPSAGPRAVSQSVVDAKRSALALDNIRLRGIRPSFDLSIRDTTLSSALAPSPFRPESAVLPVRPAKPMSLKERRAREPLVDCSTVSYSNNL
jgi:hypothetical protein